MLDLEAFGLQGTLPSEAAAQLPSLQCVSPMPHCPSSASSGGSMHRPCWLYCRVLNLNSNPGLFGALPMVWLPPKLLWLSTLVRMKQKHQGIKATRLCLAPGHRGNMA